MALRHWSPRRIAALWVAWLSTLAVAGLIALLGPALQTAWQHREVLATTQQIRSEHFDFVITGGRLATVAAVAFGIPGLLTAILCRARRARSDGPAA